MTMMKGSDNRGQFSLQTQQPKNWDLHRSEQSGFCFYVSAGFRCLRGENVMKGGNIYALAQILGHSNPKMTLDTYAHLSPEYINEQRRVMDAPMYAPSA
jgi:hypothetical protein